MDAPEGIAHVEAAMALEPAIGLARSALGRHFILHGERERGESIIDASLDHFAVVGMRCRFVLWHRRGAVRVLWGRNS